jgi:hypothetical protein
VGKVSKETGVGALLLQTERRQGDAPHATDQKKAVARGARHSSNAAIF